MPKSYLADEPGAARAFQNKFDPYDQVRSRVTEYESVGHPNEKIELLIWEARGALTPAPIRNGSSGAASTP
jgi:histone acetyltransferase (RNA polymerase elongator complex component)